MSIAAKWRYSGTRIAPSIRYGAGLLTKAASPPERFEVDDNDEERYDEEVMNEMRQEWEAEQGNRDLPLHKQAGYFEGLMEQADMRRKEIRENGL